MKKLITSAVTVFSLLTAAVITPAAGAYAADALWPLDSSYTEVTTQFDPSRNYGDVSGYHNAIDIPADYGANIYAACDGVCVSAEWMGAYGNMVILYHEQLGIYTFYAHCSSVAVAPGEAVSAGRVIGYVGSTGQSYGNHLHFGICTNLLGGYPTITYYDPQTYFDYGEAEAPEDCGCTDEYAGTYVTKGVDTYLNIRSGHSTSSAILGTIEPGEEFNVIKADGEWAHIEYKGVIGCCSMEFIQKTGDVVSSITAVDTTHPEGTLKTGSLFYVRGNLTSNLMITRVWGGVYASDGITDVQTAEDTPDSLTYDLAGIDKRILFDALEEGDYVFRICAQDSSGQVYIISSSVFSISDGVGSGDINDDGEVTVADAVMLQSYLLGKESLSEEQVSAADLDRDQKVTVFDFVLMKKKISGS